MRSCGTVSGSATKSVARSAGSITAASLPGPPAPPLGGLCGRARDVHRKRPPGTARNSGGRGGGDPAKRPRRKRSAASSALAQHRNGRGAHPRRVRAPERSAALS
jgi:hypothetical protein